MLNEEKVILMTRAALYEEKERGKKLKINKYFRHDYISLHLLFGWFFATVSFLLCVALWGVCNMEYLMGNIHKMDLKSFGMTLLLFYVLTVVVYACMLYGLYAYRYHMAKRSVNTYGHTLRKISEIYAQEEKNAASGALTEDVKHDSIT